jgi:thiamine-monophosphate kinase
MKVTEDELIRRIARAVPSVVGRGKREVQLGIGDDSAILSSRRRLDWVISCDAFIEGIHFLPDIHPPDSAGYKALARATSDLAAMGALPRFFLLTLALPSSRTGTWLDAFLQGVARAARLLGMKLIGGDTTRAELVTATLTVFGEVEAGKALTRSGARPGDRIYVSGKLGRAQLGLQLIRHGYGTSRRRGSRQGKNEGARAEILWLRLCRRMRSEKSTEEGKRKIGSAWATMLRPHFYPRIRIELALWLARNRIPSAIMDLSDGLSTDLARLCEASGVGARLWVDRIPRVRVPEALKEPIYGRVAPLEMALHGGDDYELIFTVPLGKERLLRSAPDSGELTCIGEIVRLGRQAGKGRVVLVDEHGNTKRLRHGGWDSFR